MVNGVGPVWVERAGRLERTDVRFASAADLRDAIERILAPLGRRVDEALRRADLHRVTKANGAETAVPWARSALAYLDKRRDSGAAGQCSLPELFAAVRPEHEDLSIPAYLDGLRRLHDRRAIQLLPFEGSASELPQPEYALLDGAEVFFYVTR